MYGIEDKLLAILYSLMILLIAIGVRVVTGTFLIPAGIFALAWFVFTFLPLIFLFWVPINSLAVLYILGATFLFFLSAIPFNWQLAFRLNLTKSLVAVKFDSPFLEIVFYVSVIASALLSLLTMLINGFTVEQVIFELLKTSGEYAAVRGTEGLDYGSIGILSTMFTYLCPVLAGLRSLYPRGKRFFVISLAPSLLIMVTQSSKLVFLVSLCFYVASALIAKIYAKQMGLPKVSGLPKLIFGTALLVFLILISFVSRLGDFDLESIGAITEPLLFSIISYTMGQIYAFADFFSFTVGQASASYFKDEFFSYGAYTFASIFDMFGYGKEFPPGMYEESGWYREVFETNVFTFFRGLIYDFGVAGSLFFIFVLGIFVHIMTLHILAKTHAWLALSTFLAVIVFIFMGYLFSVFVARYVFLIATVTWLLFNLNAYLYEIKNEPCSQTKSK